MKLRKCFPPNRRPRPPEHSRSTMLRNRLPPISDRPAAPSCPSYRVFDAGSSKTGRKMLFGSLLVGVVVLAIACLSLAVQRRPAIRRVWRTEPIVGRLGRKARPGQSRRQARRQRPKGVSKTCRRQPRGETGLCGTVDRRLKVGGRRRRRRGQNCLDRQIAAASGKGGEDRLLIGVEVQNLSATRKVDFIGWTRDGIARGARLTDNFGNVYKPLPVGRLAVAGQGPPMSIYPSKSGRELLAFEPPIAKAEFLRLELSAVAFGKDNVVRLMIPTKRSTPRMDLIELDVANPAASGGDSKKSAKKARGPAGHARRRLRHPPRRRLAVAETSRSGGVDILSARSAGYSLADKNVCPTMAAIMLQHGRSAMPAWALADRARNKEQIA